jgi:nucleotide-binding universal stress UspA family protein
MYSSVIVGVDGQLGGRDASALAASLTAGAVRLALVHVCVIDPIPMRGSNGAFELADAEEAIELIEKERSLLGRDSDAIRVPATTVGGGLDSVAGDREADLIVIGSCHRHRVGRVLAGDDAASVLHHAHCAVAIAPAGYASDPKKIERIGLAYDGSAESKVALANASSLAAGLGATVVARYVATPHVYAAGAGLAGSYLEDADDLVAVALEQLGDLGDVQLDIVVGSVTPELAALSEEVDLMVCGSRRNGALRRVVLGSTSDYLAHHARCPLLVTPTSDQHTVDSVGDRERATVA